MLWHGLNLKLMISIYLNGLNDMLEVLQTNNHKKNKSGDDRYILLNRIFKCSDTINSLVLLAIKFLR